MDPGGRGDHHRERAVYRASRAHPRAHRWWTQLASNVGRNSHAPELGPGAWLFRPTSFPVSFLLRGNRLLIRKIGLPAATQRLVDRHQVGIDRRRALSQYLLCREQAALRIQHLEEIRDALLV